MWAIEIACDECPIALSWAGPLGAHARGACSESVPTNGWLRGVLVAC